MYDKARQDAIVPAKMNFGGGFKPKEAIKTCWRINSDDELR